VEALRAKREEAEELIKRLGLPKLEVEAYNLREVEGGPPPRQDI
jgi:hypothetical protein